MPENTGFGKRLLFAIAISALLLAILAFITIRHIPPSDSQYDLVGMLASMMPFIGYAGLFAILLFENTSVPLPGEFFLPLAGYYVFVGRMSVLGVVTVSAFASLLGSLLIFFLARRFGAPLVYWGATRLGLSQRTLAKNEIRLCGKYGSALVLLSRFVPFFGSAIALPASALRMNMARFVFLSLIGSVASTMLYLFIGYSVGPIMKQNEIFLSGLVVQNILVALAVVCSVYIGYYSLRRWKQKRNEKSFLRKTGILLEASESPGQSEPSEDPMA